MMLDKSQITEWDGEPEANGKPEAPKTSGSPLFESREAVPTGEKVMLTPEQAKARKRRGQWLALGLFAFVILIFVLTMTKIGAQILVRDL